MFCFVLLSGCSNLHYKQQWGIFLFLHTFSVILLFVEVLMMATLTGVKWHLIVVLVCFSLIISYDEHLLMFLLADCRFSLEKEVFGEKSVYLGLLPNFWLDCLLFWYRIVLAIRIFAKLSHFWLHCLQISSPICSVPFHFVYDIFAVQKLVSLIIFILVYFYFYFFLGDLLKKILLWFFVRECFACVFF